MRPKSLFRFDASPAIGGGHAVRSLALAKAMTSAGWDCRLAVSRTTTATIPALADADMPLIPLPDSGFAEPCTLTAAAPDGVDLLILDHYQCGRSYEERCRGWARHIAVIDDLPSRQHDCDILTDPTLGRETVAYRPLVPSRARILVGSKFAILRPAFAEARQAALERRQRLGPVERILVSFGMADPDNLAGRALIAIAESGIKAAVDVVLGASAPHRAKVEAAHRALPGGGAIHAYVEDMAGLMAQADLAIGAAGSSTWERCCLGLPTFMFVLADNQRDIALALERHGAAENLGTPEDSAFERLANRIAALARQADARARMSHAAAAICDGKGAQRLIETFVALAHA